MTDLAVKQLGQREIHLLDARARKVGNSNRNSFPLDMNLMFCAAENLTSLIDFEDVLDCTSEC
jgi:hypothetical protein